MQNQRFCRSDSKPTLQVPLTAPVIASRALYWIVTIVTMQFLSGRGFQTSTLINCCFICREQFFELFFLTRSVMCLCQINCSNFQATPFFRGHFCLPWRNVMTLIALVTLPSSPKMTVSVFLSVSLHIWTLKNNLINTTFQHLKGY